MSAKGSEGGRRVLVLDPDESMRASVRLLLAAHFPDLDVRAMARLDEEARREPDFHVVIAGSGFRGGSAVNVLNTVAAQWPQARRLRLRAPWDDEPDGTPSTEVARVNPMDPEGFVATLRQLLVDAGKDPADPASA